MANDPYRISSTLKRRLRGYGRYGRHSPDVRLSDALDQLLRDPIIQLVMKADRVDAAQVQSLYRKLCSPDVGVTGSSREGDMSIYAIEDKQYRSGVGIMLMNGHNEVFVGQRIQTSEAAWQMPQGGIDEGEDARTAALRELREEIGTDNVRVLAVSCGWLRYDLPADLLGKAWGGRWRGQQQKWFAMRFLGSDAEINVATEHPEFLDWRWVPSSHLPELIVSFKRQLYLDVLHQFKDIHSEEAPSGRTQQ
jgi:putative (di)nucleoside polyphosphate hydrolase